ncbi:MAG: CDP-alcohol phosphatidyltransferase family protein [Proteobacteria bacterium]|nr:CDP-alcohol phosphatidyltransferase family protein [Pseudomonadota bacterium]MCH8098242.1 CDP-alcohol phosphatidyltransferase family protein [Pseudomonadota bacterium]
MNLPNLISLARLLSVPLLVWAILAAKMELAFWLFVAAGISDAVDGFIAKHFGATSALGKYLDPLADKALLLGVYVTLGNAGYLPTWLVILVVFREVIIIGGAILILMLTEEAKIETLRISKINTAAQILLAAVILAIAAMELKEGELPWMQVYIAWGLTYLVAVTTFLSGAGYIVKWGRKAESMEDSP